MHGPDSHTRGLRAFAAVKALLLRVGQISWNLVPLSDEIKGERLRHIANRNSAFRDPSARLRAHLSTRR